MLPKAVLSATVILAAFLGLLLSVLLAVFLPVWASASVVLATLVLATIGGGELLAKAAACGLALLAVWGWRRRKRRPADAKLVAIPEPRAPSAPARRRTTEQRAA